MNDVAERFADVESRIAQACRAAGRAREEVRLVAISKRQPEERLVAAIEAGHAVFGENYPQELQRKAETHPEVRWHFVGHLQRNKVKMMERCDLIHAVDSERLGVALDAWFETRGRPVPCLVQVHQGGEATKSGVPPDQTEALLRRLLELPHIEVQGLMTLPPPGEGRRHFAALRELRDRLQATLGHPLPELSMGMSDDFADAIAEGATWIRIGTALFGPRPD